MSTIRIQLAQIPARSRMWLDDVEITHHLRGFTITAEVGAISEITLVLSAPVELEGEVARVLLNRNPEIDRLTHDRRLESAEAYRFRVPAEDRCHRRRGDPEFDELVGRS
jgi:hypothetical protein